MERVAVPVGTRKRVLEDLFRGLPITGQAICRPVDRVAVASEELFEGVQIVGLDTAQQVASIFWLADGAVPPAASFVVSISVRGLAPRPVLSLRYAAAG